MSFNSTFGANFSTPAAAATPNPFSTASAASFTNGNPLNAFGTTPANTFGPSSSSFSTPANAAAAANSASQPAAFGLGQLPQTPAAASSLTSASVASPNAAAASRFGAIPQNELHPLLAIQNVKDSFDAASPFYKFKHVFYNVRADGDATSNTHPSGGGDDDDVLWRQAIADNPQPQRLTPVVVRGVEGVASRAAFQSQRLQLHRQKLDELRAALASFRRLARVDFEGRVAELSRAQAALTQRVEDVGRSVQIVRHRGFAFGADEERLRTRIDDVSRAVAKEAAPFQQRIVQLLRGSHSHGSESCAQSLNEALLGRRAGDTHAEAMQPPALHAEVAVAVREQLAAHAQMLQRLLASVCDARRRAAALLLDADGMAFDFSILK